MDDAVKMVYKGELVDLLEPYISVRFLTRILRNGDECSVKTSDLSIPKEKIKKLSVRDKIVLILEEVEEKGLTVDGIVVALDLRYSRSQPGDHNAVAPQFSVGSGSSLYDEGEVVCTGVGITRSGREAQSWVLKRFATEQQIRASREQYKNDLLNQLKDLREKLLDLPIQIESIESRIQYLNSLEETSCKS